MAYTCADLWRAVKKVGRFEEERECRHWVRFKDEAASQSLLQADEVLIPILNNIIFFPKIDKVNATNCNSATDKLATEQIDPNDKMDLILGAFLFEEG